MGGKKKELSCSFFSVFFFLSSSQTGDSMRQKTIWNFSKKKNCSENWEYDNSNTLTGRAWNSRKNRKKSFSRWQQIKISSTECDDDNRIEPRRPKKPSIWKRCISINLLNYIENHSEKWPILCFCVTDTNFIKFWYSAQITKLYFMYDCVTSMLCASVYVSFCINWITLRANKVTETIIGRLTGTVSFAIWQILFVYVIVCVRCVCVYVNVSRCRLFDYRFDILQKRKAKIFIYWMADIVWKPLATISQTSMKLLYTNEPTNICSHRRMQNVNGKNREQKTRNK